MTLMLKNILAEPAEILRPYCLHPSVQSTSDMRLFSSMQIKWNDTRGLGYSYPFPDQNLLNEFYTTLYRQVMNKRRGIEHYISSPNYRAQAQSQVSWVKDIVANQGEWLDVGAGFGLLLWIVRQKLTHWQLYAVEPDLAAYYDLKNFVEVERDFPGFFEGKVFTANKFDVISSSHVIEHLIDPFLSLKAFHYYIKPGGYLLIEVPHDNYDELLREKRISDLPHLWFFSSSGLARIVEEAGFQVERIAVLGVKRPGIKDNSFVRFRRALARQFRGPLALLDDPKWYAEGKDRCDIRILARKPII